MKSWSDTAVVVTKDAIPEKVLEAVSSKGLK